MNHSKKLPWRLIPLDSCRLSSTLFSSLSAVRVFKRRRTEKKKQNGAKKKRKKKRGKREAIAVRVLIGIKEGAVFTTSFSERPFFFFLFLFSFCFLFFCSAGLCVWPFWLLLFPLFETESAGLFRATPNESQLPPFGSQLLASALPVARRDAKTKRKKKRKFIRRRRRRTRFRSPSIEIGGSRSDWLSSRGGPSISIAETICSRIRLGT